MELTHTHMSWVCSLSTGEADRITFALFYVQVYQPILGIVTFCQFFDATPSPQKGRAKNGYHQQ
jgi:hypothetical protein